MSIYKNDELELNEFAMSELYTVGPCIIKVLGHIRKIAITCEFQNSTIGIMFLGQISF